MTDQLQLALGPVQYYWPKPQLLDFYRQVHDWPVDIVYLGETICSKRRPLRLAEWLELAESLEASGKQVVLSTLTLVEAESELSFMRRICDNGRYWVEANDMAAVQMLSESALPFVTGPSVNIYNPATLAFLARLGLRRWVLPVELSSQCLAEFRPQLPAGVATEVFAYGRLPLAYSARCFTARAHDRGKDDCEFLCLHDPDGREIRTREAQDLLTLNGIQTQSALTFSLLDRVAQARELGVAVLRISPQAEHTGAVVAAFDLARQGRLPDASLQALDRLMPIGRCNGYWQGEPGMALSAV